MGLSFDEVQRAILRRTPVSTFRRRRMTGQVLNIILAANWLREMNQPVSAATVSDRLAALDLADFKGNQVIGDTLGDHGLRLAHQKVKGKTVYTVPDGGITRALVEAHFDCRDWHWDADDEDEPDLSDGLEDQADQDEPDLSDGPEDQADEAE
jgi:hypothetical protein